METAQPETPKKSHRGVTIVIILAVILVLLGIGAAVYYFLREKKETPAENIALDFIISGKVGGIRQVYVDNQVVDTVDKGVDSPLLIGGPPDGPFIVSRGGIHQTNTSYNTVDDAKKAFKAGLGKLNRSNTTMSLVTYSADTDKITLVRTETIKL